MEFQDGVRLSDFCKPFMNDLMHASHAESIITEENVLQEANPDVLKIMDSMLDITLLPGSGVNGIENIKKFISLMHEGKRGLLLVEHYSNFDLPALSYLLRHSGCEEAAEIANKLVAIAGMKLNEDNPMVSAWASGFSRVIIYPSRSLTAIKDPEKHAQEEHRSRQINMASMRALDGVRREGRIILVFPAGTRYRKGHPETKRGVREIDSYIRLTDIILPVAINGNCLRISDDNPKDMTADEVWHDKVVFTAGEVLECKSFRKNIQSSLPDDMEDKKQPVVDKIMEILGNLHDEAEKIR